MRFFLLLLLISLFVGFLKAARPSVSVTVEYSEDPENQLKESWKNPASFASPDDEAIAAMSHREFALFIGLSSEQFEEIEAAVAASRSEGLVSHGDQTGEQRKQGEFDLASTRQAGGPRRSPKANPFSHRCQHRFQDYPVGNQCEFYQCLESEYQCTANSPGNLDAQYPLRYGFKYCNKFQRPQFNFSPAGRRWMLGTLQCLQRSLVPLLPRQPSMNCPQLTNVAFNAHPGCYTTPGNSVCFLPPSDLFLITRIIADDLFTYRSLVQVRSAMGICSNQIARAGVVVAHDAATAIRNFIARVDAMVRNVGHQNFERAFRDLDNPNW